MRLLPVTDDPLRTRVTLAEASPLGPAGTEVGFQDYFVRLRHDVAVSGIRFEGASRRAPAPGVLEALERADSIVVCPSNPVVSIGPVLAVPGVRDALAGRRERVVAVSPIIAGAALKGPADRLLAELGAEAVRGGGGPPVRAVGRHARGRRRPTPAAPAEVEAEGVRCIVAPTVMSSPERSADLARVVIDAAMLTACSSCR